MRLWKTECVCMYVWYYEFKESYKNRWTLNLMNYPCCYLALLYLSLHFQWKMCFFLIFVFNVSLPRRHTELLFYVENIKNLMTLKMFLWKMELKAVLMLRRGKATEFFVGRWDKEKYFNIKFLVFVISFFLIGFDFWMRIILWLLRVDSRYNFKLHSNIVSFV